MTNRRSTAFRVLRRLPRASRPVLRCSFCGRAGDPRRSLVAGQTPGAAICRDCVDLCLEILAERRDTP